jgi:MFS family permease
VVVLPILLLLLRGQDKTILFPKVAHKNTQRTSRNPLILFGDFKFWIILPSVFIWGFMNTAIFFYQIKFGASRGWAPEWMAASLAIYALGGAFSMLVAGPFVDRLTAKSLFPLALIPYLVGVLFLSFGENRLIYPMSLLFLAMSNGAGSTIKNALFAEVYGTEIIGAVRSMFTTIMVFSTALGPLSFGLLLDAGWTFGQVFLLSGGVLLAIIIWSLALYRRL